MAASSLEPSFNQEALLEAEVSIAYWQMTWDTQTIEVKSAHAMSTSMINYVVIHIPPVKEVGMTSQIIIKINKSYNPPSTHKDALMSMMSR